MEYGKLRIRGSRKGLFGFWLFFAVLFASPTDAQSRSGVKGTVFDYNGAVVLGVEFVRLNGRQVLVIGATDNEGRFQLDLAKGKYDLEIRHSAGHFCPIKLMGYEVVAMMSLDIVIRSWRSSQDSGKCKVKKIKF